MYHQPAINMSVLAAIAGDTHSRSLKAETARIRKRIPTTGRAVSFVRAATPNEHPAASAQRRLRVLSHINRPRAAAAHAALARQSLLMAAVVTKNLGHSATVRALATAAATRSVNIS